MLKTVELFNISVETVIDFLFDDQNIQNIT